MKLIIHSSIKASVIVRILRMAGYVFVTLGNGDTLVTAKGETEGQKAA